MARRLSDTTTAYRQTGAKRPAGDSHSDNESDRPVKKRQIRGRSMLKTCDCRWKKFKFDDRSLSKSCLLNGRICRKKTAGVRHWKPARGQCLLPTVVTEREGQESDKPTAEELSRRLDRIERRLHLMFPELFPDPDSDEVTLIDSDDDSVTVCSENNSYPVACKAATINRWLAQSPDFSDEVSYPHAIAPAKDYLREVPETCSESDTAPSFRAPSPPLTPTSSPGGGDRSRERGQGRHGIAGGAFWRLPKP
ncbi:hypothetical protein BDV27DRAFT_135582 [Aspergillus caelatus]|uniref:Uncharacterized protein n=2 Tax=Aspergillus subgen. Circumdati TaxID=2720871 RepID=A0A5N6ZQ63_9EURO|nr:uncharacterized protein BDV27DRAFT_135582 [Aspergillus caelatus]KAE8359772.1 hypothetical protein BDV27DRAFT_135582 [Aspergillus caelatus]KAE8416544.1 hypothetical protein BDV36DRAFT_296966 [Aspergillus pseudocaelatus]